MVFDMTGVAFCRGGVVADDLFVDDGVEGFTADRPSSRFDILSRRSLAGIEPAGVVTPDAIGVASRRGGVDEDILFVDDGVEGFTADNSCPSSRFGVGILSRRSLAGVVTPVGVVTLDIVFADDGVERFPADSSLSSRFGVGSILSRRSLAGVAMPPDADVDANAVTFSRSNFSASNNIHVSFRSFLANDLICSRDNIDDCGEGGPPAFVPLLSNNL